MGNAKKKTPKNRRNKQILVFDESARLEYLTGFHKRKNERRKRAKDEKEIQVKEDRKALKKRRKELMEKSFYYKGRSKQMEPELDTIGEPEVMEMPDHTVTITDISSLDMAGHSGLRLGQNEFEKISEDKETDPSVKLDVREQAKLKRDIKKLKHKAVDLINNEQPKKKSKRASHVGHIKDKKSKKKFTAKKTKAKNKLKGRQ